MIYQGSTPGRRRHQELNGGVPPGWTDVHPRQLSYALQPPRPTELFAIVSTWHDADVIEATVRNCFQLGASRVYILDNASADATVPLAMEAGAIVGRVYETELYDDDYRCQLQNELVADVTRGESYPNLWWLTLDADELPALPYGESILPWLSRLPESIRVIGSNFIDLYPSPGEQYTPGRHPAACMARGMWRWGNAYAPGKCNHWKHPLVCYRGGKFDVAQTRGNHRPATAGGELYEPERMTLTTFHAPFRREAETRARLQLLCETGRNRWDDDVTLGNGAVRRWRSLDAIYAGRWRDVEMPHTQVFGRPLKGVALYPWRELDRDLAGLFSVVVCSKCFEADGGRTLGPILPSLRVGMKCERCGAEARHENQPAN